LTFAIESWVAIVAYVSGLAGVIGQPVDAQTIARVAAALLFAILVAVVVARRGRTPGSLWAALAALVVLLVSTRLAPAGFLRSPEQIRYLFPEAVLLLLLLTELVALAEGRRIVAIAVTVVLALGLIYNVDQLRKAGALIRAKSQVALGEYSAYEMAGPALVGGYSPEPLALPARTYIDASAKYGSAADSPAELRGASLLARGSADNALVGALGIEVQATHGHNAAAGPAPEVIRPLGATVSHRAGCVRLRPSGSASASTAAPVPLNPYPSQKQALKRVLLGLPPPPAKTVPRLAELAPRGDRVRLSAADLSRVAVLLGRFQQPPHAPVDQPPHVTEGTLDLRRPVLDLPWHVTIAASRPVTICGVRSG